MLKIYYPKNLFKFSSELVILGGCLKSIPRDEPHHYNRHGKGRYHNLKEWCTDNVVYEKDPENSDIIVLPYKFKGMDDKYLKNLSKYGKQIICFYNDDDEKRYELPEKVILYRTSMKKSRKQNNEHSMPPFVTDRFELDNLIKDKNITIGFVGHIEHGRKKYIDVLRKSDFKTKFIIRDGFWAPGIDKQRAVSEYFNVMEQTLYSFCYRGGGNFSYRFFETLMMGRIPILVDTDCVLPFETQIDYSKHIIQIPEKELSRSEDICGYILKFHRTNIRNLKEIQNSNHLLWKKYFSATGFLDQVKNNLD